MPAPIGNQNAAKAKIWHAAIMRALERRERSRADGVKELDLLAEKLLMLVESGDLGALKEFGDRLDGRPAQAVVVAGDDDGGPIKMNHTVEFIGAPAATPKV